MRIWLDTNMKAHYFIPKEYWKSNCEKVKESLRKAEVYVYEDDVTNLIDGFIGLTDSYIAKFNPRLWMIIQRKKSSF